MFKMKKKIFITAEIGLNHNNNYLKTIKLINLAISAGADAVKFQLFKSQNLYPKNSKEFKFLSKFETNLEFYKKIIKYCNDKKIICYASPFDKASINFLIKNKNPIYKWGSSEIDKLGDLSLVAKQKKKMIISTGMANKIDIIQALKVCKKFNNKNIILMHCVSSYPQKFENATINKLDELKKFGFPLGFSDHSENSFSAIMAVSKGIEFLEKHITFDKKLKGPDHFYACEIKKFPKYVQDVRLAEKALGNSKLNYDDNVVFNTRRESFYAKNDIQVDKKLSLKDVYLKRSLEGLTKNSINLYLGHKIKKLIKKNEPVTGKYFNAKS